MTGNDAPLVANEEFWKLYKELSALRDEIKILEEREIAIKQMLSDAMGDNQYVCDKDGQLLMTYKFIDRQVFDNRSFKESNPELYDQFCKSIQTRMLVLKN